MIHGIFGLPGSGKSVFLTKLAKLYQKKGWDVYVNKEYPIDGCYLYDWSDIGHYQIESAVILIDEVSLYADSRDFKKFTRNLKEFFLTHRHNDLTIFWATQQYDGVDRKIREITDRLYYIRRSRRLPICSVLELQRYLYVPSIKEVKTNCNAEISVKWCRPGLFSVLTGVGRRLRFCLMFRWWKYYDSFIATKLKEKEFQQFFINPAQLPADEVDEDVEAE